ncbi:hypothetical protein KBB41_03755 [Candidatus Curtissbacteria bacterium]|jgi:hypothetical protein|nr:hypothetical protein [Candidatus Curtissbacteria bacterium]
MEFKDIKVGTFVLYNGKYAVKTDNSHIMVNGLGSDGFIEIKDEDNLIIEEDNDETGK